ncbi:MAG TPA: PAS domain S-box protein [Candidatus Saccharimonadales bacterium]|nr:PAS domain S-box protein [Candidatus Saccharimonadales bacterium]
MDAADPQSPEFYRLAMDLAPWGILLADAAGTILYVNREILRLFDYRREDLLGRPVEMLVPARFRGQHPAFRKLYAHDATPRPMGAGRDLHGRRRDGSEVPVEIGLNPIRTERGTFVLSSVVDITGRRRIEAQLRQSQKMETMGMLAGGIAHDFNNVLHGIIGHAELARRAAGQDAELRQDLERILEAAERGRQLVQRISGFSRQGETLRVPTRLEGPVREAVRLLHASLPKDIEIRELLDPNAPTVLADETQIHQVVMNLATNSAHAMPEGGPLELGLGRFEVDAEFAKTHPDLRPGPHAQLSVTDGGEGMPAEVLARAQEPFFTTKPPGTGTGLGLSVVRGIVQGMGGALEIRSRPGQGTRVDIYLPAAPAGPLPAAPGAPDRAAGAPSVLLVEDERDLAIMLRRQLEELGYPTMVFTSSLEALAEFQAHPGRYDVLMTDNSMIRMSGLMLAAEIRRIRPDLPVILVSGAASALEPEALEASGVTRVLPKPCTSREMEQALRAVLPAR